MICVYFVRHTRKNALDSLEQRASWTEMIKGDGFFTYMVISSWEEKKLLKFCGKGTMKIRPDLYNNATVETVCPFQCGKHHLIKYIRL